MADCSYYVGGDTNVIGADIEVQEVTTSGNTRRVRVIVSVWAKDYSGARDSWYSVSCDHANTNVSVGKYQGFAIDGNRQAIFDKTFNVNVASGSNTAYVRLSFTAGLTSPSAGNKQINGELYELYLTWEAEAKPTAQPSEVSTGGSNRMMENMIISLKKSNGSVRHNIYYNFCGKGDTLIEQNAEGSITWWIPDLTKQCANATKGSCTIRVDSYLSGNFIGSRNCTVEILVPRATTVQVSGNAATMGTAKDISCPRKAGGFTVVLELLFGSTTKELARGSIDSFSWVPDYALAALIPNLKYGTGTIRCTTYNGSAVVGTDTTPVSISVPENEVTRPKFTEADLKLTVVTKLTGALAGLYIRGLTGVRGEMTARSDYSSIVRYEMTVGTTQAFGDPLTVGTIQNEGDVAVTAVAVDARGYSTTVRTSIPVLPYQQPSVVPCAGESSVLCERATADGNPNSEGTYLVIHAGKSYTGLVAQGQEQNGCTLEYRYKAEAAAGFSQWVELLGVDSKETEVRAVLAGIVGSSTTSYTVELRVVDKLGGHRELRFQVGTGHISFMLYDGEDGAAFGKYAEEAHVVDIAEHMLLRVRGRLELPQKLLFLPYSENIQGRTPVRLTGRAGAEKKCCLRIENGNHVYGEISCYVNSKIRVNDQGELYFDGKGTGTGLHLPITLDDIPEEYRPKSKLFFNCNDSGKIFYNISTSDYVEKNGKTKLFNGFVLYRGWVNKSYYGQNVTFGGAEISAHFDYWI